MGGVLTGAEASRAHRAPGRARRALRLVLSLVAALAAAAVLYLLAWPVEIEPVAWQPPEPPGLAGVYAPNRRLEAVERLGEGAGVGPEDVAVDGVGRIYAGMEDGRIVRFAPDGANPEGFADTGGRPLGLDFDGAGNLIVADAFKGLLALAPDGKITVLATGAEGVPFRFTDDVDVAADGTIYFSDASSKFPYGKPVADILDHRGHGRLLAYDPETKTTRVLLAGLQFANGVAVSPDQSFVLVAETGAYRIRRYWLTGPEAGKADMLIDNLPGFPDGVSAGTGGVFWVAIFAPRNPTADALADKPFLRKVVWRLPQALQPQAERYPFILGLDRDGRVVHNLQGAGGGYAPITSVEERAGALYLGSLTEPAIGRIAVP